MGIFFVISIDTEIDKSPNWKISSDETFLSVLNGVPNKLTPLFEQFGAKPTYLLSSEIIENDDCVRVLINVRNCELGTHLHGELLEPQRRVFKFAGNNTSDMQCSYPHEVEFGKLANLTNLFSSKFGYQPTSFRAGRFGAGNNTIPNLEQLGYLVDTSITPGVDWNLPEGRANFLNAKEQPYFPCKTNILGEGDSKVLEVPISITSSRFRKVFYSIETIRELPFAEKITDYVFPALWLRPSWQSSSEMIYVIANYVERFKNNNYVVLNLMFHSMEIIPGASPYTTTEDECISFLEKIKLVLKYCVASKIKFSTLSELYPLYAMKTIGKTTLPP